MPAIHQIITAEQLLATPGLGRCELLRGELVMMSPAGGRHGRIISRITTRLETFVDKQSRGAVFGAETGFVIARNPDTVRAPDVAFVRAQRLPPELPEGFFDGPPDLAVEVLSPGDRASEVLAKVHEWLAAGCLAVWVVDPRARTVTVYDARQRAVVVGNGDSVTGGEVLAGFSLPVEDIFAG